MNTAPIFPRETSSDDAALFSHRRAAIDLIATTEACLMRAALSGAYLFRAHPTAPEDDKARAEWRAALADQCAQLSRISTLLTGTDPTGTLAAPACAWLGDFATTRPKQRAAFDRSRDLTHDILRAVDGGDAHAIETAMNAHLAHGRGGFFDLVTEFCEGLWARLDRDQRQGVIKDTAATITKTLQRLEHIGKHVRLVSLNASVEAARVGDAGRGLGVIAVEFKTLAEEIRRLATTASADIAAMARQTDKTEAVKPRTTP